MDMVIYATGAKMEKRSCSDEWTNILDDVIAMGI